MKGIPAYFLTCTLCVVMLLSKGSSPCMPIDIVQALGHGRHQVQNVHSLKLSSGHLSLLDRMRAGETCDATCRQHAANGYKRFSLCRLGSQREASLKGY